MHSPPFLAPLSLTAYKGESICHTSLAEMPPLLLPFPAPEALSNLLSSLEYEVVGDGHDTEYIDLSNASTSGAVITY